MFRSNLAIALAAVALLVSSVSAVVASGDNGSTSGSSHPSSHYSASYGSSSSSGKCKPSFDGNYKNDPPCSKGW